MTTSLPRIGGKRIYQNNSNRIGNILNQDPTAFTPQPTAGGKGGDLTRASSDDQLSGEAAQYAQQF